MRGVKNQNKMIEKFLGFICLFAVIFLVANAEQSDIPFISNSTSQVVSDPLENCEIYFDGCNKCKVGPHKQLACTRMFCTNEMMREPRCEKYKTDSTDL